MRLFLFFLIGILIMLFLFVIYCLLRVGAEEDRRLDKYFKETCSKEKDYDEKNHE